MPSRFRHVRLRETPIVVGSVQHMTDAEGYLEPQPDAETAAKLRGHPNYEEVVTAPLPPPPSTPAPPELDAPPAPKKTTRRKTRRRSK